MGPKLAVGAPLVLWSRVGDIPQPDDSPAPIVQAAASTESAVAESEQILLNVRAVADLLASTEATGAELSSAAIALTDLDTVSRDLVLVSDDFTRASQPRLATLASEAERTRNRYLRSAQPVPVVPVGVQSDSGLARTAIGS